MVAMEQPQQSVLEFLGRPRTPGEPPPRRIDTHAASVFLFPERALKIKRAVRFPFLDYLTLELRRAACEAELAVNRPFAPQIYRRVIPVTRESDGSFAIGGAGEPVEWAVEMARFDENRTLDHLAERGEIDAALADALGRAVAAAHAQTQVAEAEPWITAIGDYVDEHASVFGAAPDLFPPDDAATLTQASRAAFARIRPLLEARGDRGLIRRCHGDLHLGNIVVLDGKPVLFDAIEFDPVIASGDVLYDLAFLLMDLFARNLTHAANVVFNRYLVETDRDADLDGLAALPFLLSMRAAIRAKVTAARLRQDPKHDRDAIAAAARKYFHLALQLIMPSTPKLIAVGGLSGTGKSLLARMLAPRVPPVPGAVLLRSDVERKRLFGVGETERLPKDAYTPEVSARIYAALEGKARTVIAAGHSAVVDAVFAMPEERRALADIARRARVPLHGLFLTADLAVRLQRVGGRRGDASDADAAVVTQQEEYPLDAMDWTAVDANCTPEETLRRALSSLPATRIPDG
ncbi:MAG: AAA family ATPase [Rhizobiales bacterium]|nr:AAA family ATPase [Hyphomicrobiales bacterium]